MTPYPAITPPDPPRPDCFCGVVDGFAGRCEKCEIALCYACVQRCAACQAEFCRKHLVKSCAPEQGVFLACSTCAEMAWRAQRAQALKDAEKFVYLGGADGYWQERVLEYLRTERRKVSIIPLAEFMAEEAWAANERITHEKG